MKKLKTAGISILLAACVACLSLAFVACTGGEKNANYGAGEEGFYYYDASDSTRYMLSLQSGTYMITANGDAAYSGEYSYDEETGEISFTGDEKFTAAVGENALSLDMGDSGYSFKAYRYFDVTYVDENGKVVATEFVLNGQSAEALEIEKDGYYFIGWYEDSANSSEFAFNTSIAGDTTVYGWYIAINENATDFAVTLDYGDGYTETEATMNGAVWSLPSSYNGSDILGWWVSATNKSGEFTYKYDIGDVFTANTTLFAVYDGIGASVTGFGITWDASRAGANISITITDENGETVLTANLSSSSGSYTSPDFTALGTGIYTVTAGTDTLTYVVNGLTRVSLSDTSVVLNGEGRVLSFAPVDNATSYEITVTDGERTVTENLGSRTYYNFSDWDMTKDGITFTVTAYADGYVSSVSDAYNYLLALDKVTIDIDGENVVWSRVENALEYEVTIYGKDDAVVESFYTTDTSYSLKYYDAGTYTITVQPVTSGYWSEETEYSGYAKITLASPVITSITDYSVTWDPVTGAISYVVSVNGSEYPVEEGATLYFTDSDVSIDTGLNSYEIAVKAVETNGNDSSYSDAVTATNGAFSSAVSYEKNTVSWNYDISATSYVISVNGGAKTYTVDGTNSREIELTKVGDNEIVITAYSGSEAIGQASLSVYAYSVTLDGNGLTTEKGVIYVAQGDTLKLGGVSGDKLEHAEFIGWYTQADYTEGQSDSYEGKGSEVLDGSTFTGNRNTYLYAYWSYQYIDVKLVSNMGSMTDENGDEVESLTVKIKYNSTSFELPTPTPYDDADNFGGWNTALNGSGTSYTGQNGLSNGTAFAGETTLYAYYRALLYYERTTYNGETVYSVSAGPEIESAENGEITVPGSYNGYNLILNSTSFAYCTSLMVLNIPDTVLYIPTVNDGYRTGTGAFAGCSALKEVNVYSTGNAAEPVYFSDGGVLFHKISTSEAGDVELIYYPYAKATDASGVYRIPATVYNENEIGYDGTPVVHNVASISTQVFRDKTFTSVTIPSTVTYIASQAFYNNSSLTTVVFEEGSSAELELADNAFTQCASVASVTLPSRYSNFNAEAFAGCVSLMNVYIAEGGAYSSDGGILLDANGNTLIYYPIGRSGDVVTSELTSTNITAIGEKAFANNIKITSVTISDMIAEIGESAFEGCGAVTTLTFNGTDNSPNLTIRENAFYGCYLISEVKLPSNLVKMEKNAFGGCNGLLTVYFDARSGSTDTLEFATGSFGTSNYVMTLTLGANVPEIDFVSIFGGSYLSKVIIEDGVDKDGNAVTNKFYYSDSDGAVYNAEKTTILYYPIGRLGAYEVLDTTTTIGSSVFAGNVNLTSVTIGALVTEIKDGAFDGCAYLEKIIVKDGNGAYGSDANGILYEKDNEGNLAKLIYCPVRCAASDITVGSTVVGIESYAFKGNVTVESVTFTSSTLQLSSYTFNGASSLKTVALPDTLTDGKIPEYAFYNCSSLVSVNIPSNVTVIEKYAFNGCKLITGDLTNGTVELPEGLVTIGERAFYNCNELAVTIPYTVTTIETYAFYACWDSLTTEVEIVFASAPVGSTGVELSIGSYAFANNYYATKVVVPARATSLGNYAFVYLGMGLEEFGKNTVIEFEEGTMLTSLPQYIFRGSRPTTVTLPASLTSIGSHAFWQATTLTSVSFAPEGETTSLTTISEYAFYGTGLTSVTIPDTVTSIETYAFTSTPLTEIVFGDGGNLTSIGAYAFNACTGLTTVDIPASVSTLDKGAFYGCENLVSVTFCGAGETSALTTLGVNAFYNCSSLLGIILPSGISAVANNDFFGCSSIQSISIPAKVESLGTQSFYGCTKLSAITFETDPDTHLCALASIGDKAFYNCTALTEFVFPDTSASVIALGESIFNGSGLTTISIPKKVTDIGLAFEGFFGIENFSVEEGHTVYATGDDGQILYDISMGTIVYAYAELKGAYTIPEGVTYIEDYAFYMQDGITDLTIASTVTTIGEYAFSECTGLETVTFAGGNQANIYFGVSAFDGDTKLKSIDLEGITDLEDYVFYNCDLSETKIPTSLRNTGIGVFWYTNVTEVILPNIVTLGNYTFRESSVTTVVLGDTLQSLGNSCFRSCSNLSSATLPASISKISQYTFYNCSSLTEFTIPDSVTSIEMYAFTRTGIESMVIPAAVTSVESNLFEDCSSLESCVLPSGITSMPTYVFSGCVSLKSISMPDSVTSIGSYCFNGCTSLESIELGDKITSISNNAFESSGIKTIIIPKGVTSIGSYAFRYCESLTYAYTGDSVTAIPNGLFTGCVSLETVELGPAVKTIGISAFQDCTSLTSINLGSGLTTMSNYAFRGCTSLKTLYIPSTVSYVDTFAFCECDCDIFIENTQNFVDYNWGEWWNGEDSSGHEDDDEWYYGEMYENTGTIYYYSQTEPAVNDEGTDYNGNFWYYNDAGEMTVWSFEKA